MSSIVFRGGELWEGHETITSKQLLLLFPHAAYTTMRTVGKDFVFELDTHLDRIVAATSKRREMPVTREEVDRVVMPDLEKAIVSFEKQFESLEADQEFRIYLLVTTSNDRKESALDPANLPLLQSPLIREGRGNEEGRAEDSDKLESWVFVEKMPAPLTDASGRVRVEVRQCTRQDPTIKSVAWVKERQWIEKEMKPGTNECLMCDEEGNIHEGLSSNFIVLHKDSNTIQTSPPGTVLLGTVLKIALGCAQALGMDVLLKEPNIQEASSWDAACVTSTSRLVNPVNEIECLVEGKKSITQLPNPSECVSLSRLLHEFQSAIIRHSRQVVFRR